MPCKCDCHERGCPQPLPTHNAVVHPGTVVQPFPAVIEWTGEYLITECSVDWDKLSLIPSGGLRNGLSGG